MSSVFRLAAINNHINQHTLSTEELFNLFPDVINLCINTCNQTFYYSLYLVESFKFDMD